MAYHKDKGPEYGRKDLPLKENGRRFSVNCSYDPEHIDVLLRMMKKGATYAMVARELQTSTQTLRNWRKDHPEWEKAYEMGKDWAQAHFESEALENLVIFEGKDDPKIKFNSTVYIFEMKTRFGRKEADEQTIVHVDGTQDPDIKKARKVAADYHQEAIARGEPVAEDPPHEEDLLLQVQKKDI